MRNLLILCFIFISPPSLFAQPEAELIKRVKAKMEKVKDYQAVGKMKLDVSFIKAPDSKVNVYYKSPNQFKVKKTGGISILPKGGVIVNVNTILADDNYTVVPSGKEMMNGSEVTVVILLPKGDNSDVVLTKLFVDEKDLVIRRANVTTRESGSYEVQLDYGKFASWGLPDKVIFSFNTKEYKVPKGVTFEYEKGGSKKAEDKLKNKKGKVEITYSSYEINKGIDSKIFQ